jgi:hypothetical protein
MTTLVAVEQESIHPKVVQVVKKGTAVSQGEKAATDLTDVIAGDP